VALPERLDGAAILSLNRGFDGYRRFRREPFQRVQLRTKWCLIILNPAPALVSPALSEWLTRRRLTTP